MTEQEELPYGMPVRLDLARALMNPCLKRLPVVDAPEAAICKVVRVSLDSVVAELSVGSAAVTQGVRSLVRLSAASKPTAPEAKLAKAS